MQPNDIQFTIQGPQADEVAQALADLIEQTFNHAVKPSPAPAPPPVGDAKTDPVAVAALVLAIPSALLATFDLVQRFKKKPEADRMVALAQKLIEQYPQTLITIAAPEGLRVHLHQTDGNTLLDMAKQIGQD